MQLKSFFLIGAVATGVFAAPSSWGNNAGNSGDSAPAAPAPAGPAPAPAPAAPAPAPAHPAPAPPAPAAPAPAPSAPAAPAPAPSVPGFPPGSGSCLTDAQAAFVVGQFKSILTNVDRKAAATTANALLDAQYTETSDSIDVLDGSPQGSVSFNSKQAFISGVTGAPAIGSMTDLDIIHDCTKVVWQWLASGIAMNVSPVKGFNKLTVDPSSGIVKSNELEFNSIAWGRDIGWTCTAPPQGQY